MRNPTRIPAGIGLIAAALCACAPKPKPQALRPHEVLNLDSLNRLSEHQDSVDANLPFYESAWETYKQRFPGVDKPTYMRVAKGKDQEFCLFKNDPAKTCLEVGDKYNDAGLKAPARDAYEAGLISEGANDGKTNMRLWASLAQIHFDEKDYDGAKSYLSKVLEVEPKNKWAKKLWAMAPIEE